MISIGRFLISPQLFQRQGQRKLNSQIKSKSINQNLNQRQKQKLSLRKTNNLSLLTLMTMRWSWRRITSHSVILLNLRIKTKSFEKAQMGQTQSCILEFF